MARSRRGCPGLEPSTPDRGDGGDEGEGRGLRGRDHLYRNPAVFSGCVPRCAQVRVSLSPSFLLPFVPFYRLSPAPISRKTHPLAPPRAVYFSPPAMNEGGNAGRIPSFMLSSSISPRFSVLYPCCTNPFIPSPLSAALRYILYVIRHVLLPAFRTFVLFSASLASSLLADVS